MGDARSWLHQTMIADSTLLGLLGLTGDVVDPVNLVMSGKALVGAPASWPFIVHIMGNDTSEGLAERSSAHRQYALIYVHDHGEDYLAVDAVLERLMTLLHGAPSSRTWGVTTATHLENSRDLDDQELGTICRYLRLQIILAN